MKEATIRNAQKKWSEACNLWVYLLCEQWGVDGRKGYWIGGQVGGVWDMDGVVIMGMDDIIYAVKHSVPMKAYDDWRDYCMDISELKIDTPSFIDYCNGMGVLNKESLDRLLQMKRDLDKLVEEEKSKLKAK